MSAAGSDRILERMMALHPKVIDLSLERMPPLLARLGNPERHLPPVIHIAGTNGKGSTQAMIRAGLEGVGKAVHAYTSPHLARFHERIRVAGEIISEPALVDVLSRTLAANEDRPITFFEITNVAAFLAFAETPADYTLLEVGLGGRFDSTNIVADPRLCIITPISIDHTGFLGDTLARIASAKAGIIKPGVPCIVTRQPDEAMAVIEAEAEAQAAPLIVQGRDWDAWEERGRLVYQDEAGLFDLPPPALMGAHQFQNAGSAIAALRHLGFGEAAAEAAVTEVSWPARMQRLRHGPLIDAAPGAELWLDGGHNPACGAALAETLTRLPDRPTHLICGMLNTKDIAGYLAPLVPHASSLTAVSIPGEAATLPANETAARARDAGIPALTGDGTAEDVAAAVAAIVAGDPGARILICGSLYLAGQVLRENG